MNIKTKMKCLEVGMYITAALAVTLVVLIAVQHFIPWAVLNISNV